MNQALESDNFKKHLNVTLNKKVFVIKWKNKKEVKDEKVEQSTTIDFVFLFHFCWQSFFMC